MRREDDGRPGGRRADITIRRRTGKKMGKIDNERAMSLYRDGARDSELARLFGVSESAVGQWRKKNGLDKNVKRGEAAGSLHQSAPAPSSEGALEAEERPVDADQAVREAEAMKDAEESEEMNETEKKPELVERILAHIERKIRQTDAEIHEVAEHEGEALTLVCKKRALNEIEEEIRLLRVLEEHGL